MTLRRALAPGFAAALALLAVPSLLADLTPDQARRIRAALPKEPRAEPRSERRVLIWNTPHMERSPHKGYTIPQAAYAFGQLGERTGAFEARVSDDVSLLLPESIRRFDAIVLNNSCGPWITPTPEAMEKLADRGDAREVEALLKESLLDWVAAGGGIVAYHYAIGANRDWPEYRELLGAGYWGHPWNEEVGVRVDEPDHPLVRAFDGRDFRIADEIYQFREPYSRERVRVLLSLDTSATNMEVQWIHRKDGDFALAWVKRHGKGRVFYTSFGHRTEIWWNEAMLRFFLDAVQFAAGDIDAPTEPSARGSGKPAPAGRSERSGDPSGAADEGDEAR